MLVEKILVSLNLLFNKLKWQMADFVQKNCYFELKRHMHCNFFESFLYLVIPSLFIDTPLIYDYLLAIQYSANCSQTYDYYGVYPQTVQTVKEKFERHEQQEA